MIFIATSRPLRQTFRYGYSGVVSLCLRYLLANFHNSLPYLRSPSVNHLIDSQGNAHSQALWTPCSNRLAFLSPACAPIQYLLSRSIEWIVHWAGHPPNILHLLWGERFSPLLSIYFISFNRYFRSAWCYWRPFIYLCCQPLFPSDDCCARISRRNDPTRNRRNY